MAPRKRAPRLGGINKSEQVWIDLLLESHLDGFKSIVACQYLSDQKTISGGYYSRVPNQFRMNTILKKSKRFRKERLSNTGVRWWRIRGEEE